jgi:Golgi SNAP receptor complex protein 2
MDEMLFLGQSTLESLRSQRGILKSTHRRLLDGLTHMGVSKNIIRVIERKSAQDKWIFWGGVCLTLAVIYLCWRYFS